MKDMTRYLAKLRNLLISVKGIVLKHKLMSLKRTSVSIIRRIKALKAIHFTLPMMLYYCFSAHNNQKKEDYALLLKNIVNNDTIL